MVSMNSKERVLTALATREPDRVPINYFSNPGIDLRLKKHFGLKHDDAEGLRKALGVDFRDIRAPYVGPKLHADIPERGVKVDDWGVHTMYVEHSSGGYWDFCDFPLRGATEEEVAAWPMPSPDDFDYSRVEAQCKELEDYALVLGDAGFGDVLNSTGFVMGMEQMFMDLACDEPAVLLLIKRRIEILLEVGRRTIEAAKGRLNIMWMGEDLGTQQKPMVSAELYRRNIRPIHEQFVNLAKANDLKVIIHTCGSSSWVYPDFIEMGITGVDTMQPEAVNMSPAYLKKTFGGRLAFHGCISTAGPVASGTAAETTTYCRNTLEIMMPGGGYCFSPTHCLQDNSPTENVVAMYEAAHQYGRY